MYDYVNNHLQAVAEYLVKTTSSPFNFIPWNPVIAPFSSLNCLLVGICSAGSEELELQ